jgi:myosin heavy subunit
LENINVNTLLKNDKNETRKLASALIMYLFNCEKKDAYIDKIAMFDDYHQQELLKIVEKYMYIDETEKIISRSVSQRNTIGDYFTESDFTAKYMSRINNLEKERDNIEREKMELTNKMTELENEYGLIVNENQMLHEKVNKNQQSNHKKDYELEQLKKNNFDLNSNIKQLVEHTKEVKTIPELRARLDDKDAEIKQAKKDYSDLEASHAVEVNKLNEQIDLLHENISRLSDMKGKYEKMKEAFKDHDVIKDKLNYYETVNKDYTKLKMNYLTLSEEKNSLEKIVKDYEHKERSSSLIKSVTKTEPVREDRELKQQLEKKDQVIKELRNKLIRHEEEISTLEENLVRQNKEKSQKEVIYKEVVVEKEIPSKEIANEIKPIDDSVFLDKIKQLENEMRKIKLETEAEISKKNEEVEFYKKDNEETKDRYEKEFELMASSVYNLGLNYWSMKMEYTQRLNEISSWIIKKYNNLFLYYFFCYYCSYTKNCPNLNFLQISFIFKLFIVYSHFYI